MKKTSATDVAEGALSIRAKQAVLDQPLDKEVVGTRTSFDMHNIHAAIEVPG